MKKNRNNEITERRGADTSPDKGLSGVPTVNPFTVPHDYFDQLATEILNKTTEKNPPAFSLKEQLMMIRMPYKVAIAAAFVVIACCLSYVIFMTNDNSRIGDWAGQITTSELIEFDGYLVDLDESLVNEWVDKGGEEVSRELADLEGLDELSEADVIAYLRQSYSDDELRLEIY